MSRFLFVLAFVVCSGTLHAQKAYKAPADALRQLKKVEQAMIDLDWNESRSLSDRLVKRYPEWIEAWKIRAEVYQGSGDIKNSEIALRHLVRLDSLAYPEAYRWIAEWSFQRGDYSVASVNMKKYLGSVSDTAGLPYSVRILRSSIRFAIQQTTKESVTKPEKLAGPINTDQDEYFPSLSVDGSTLVFTRQTKGEGIPTEDLLYTFYRDSGYVKPELFPYPINTSGNEGTQSLSQDGRVMFFTACNRPDTKGGCDLYYCIKTGDQWSEPVNLGYPVNTRYWESTPFLTQDGKRLLFASNRPGGSGGMDIWQVSLMPDRSWSKLVNLGSPVNTPLDERSPIMLVDGKTLFFTSNGHVGMGGFDLYKYVMDKQRGTHQPENLGYMVNTHGDEDALTVDAGHNLGLFTSNRDTLNGKDIYQIDMSRYIPKRTVFTLSGIVRDRKSGLPVGASIEVQPHGDTLVSRVEADPVTGEFLMGISERPSYRIGASHTGYLPYSQFFENDTLLWNEKVEYLIEMEPVQAGAAIVLQNIFFDFNSYELLPGSGQDLESVIALFQQNPGITVEVSGHTDNTGTDEYNLVLSRKRAEAVVKYLISRGISATQLSAKGYGRTNPRSTNESEEGRALNRRTELKILSVR